MLHKLLYIIFMFLAWVFVVLILVADTVRKTISKLGYWTDCRLDKLGQRD